MVAIIDEREDCSDEREERLSLLHQCFQALSGDNQAFINLRYQGGLSMEQMAMEVGKTSGAVRTKLHRLRRSLRDCVQNHLREEKI